jgi:YggT family protein
MGRPILIEIFSKLVWVVEVYAWLTIFRIIVSWFNPNPYNSFLRFTFKLTDPALTFLTDVIPPLKVRTVDYTELTVVLILLLILVIRHLWRYITSRSPHY